MATLSIFANFYINSDETFLRMKDSFDSFKDIRAEKWVINIRGKYKAEAMSYIKNGVEEKLISYYLDSKEGWFHDTKQMLKDISTDFVFFWLEDHINIAPITAYDELIDEMFKSHSDFVCYSWWNNERLQNVYKDVPKTEYSHISSFVLDKRTQKEVEKKYPAFIIGMVGIFSASLFKKVVLETSLFMRQYPKYTPFNFEKGGGEKKWLPLNYAILKKELFASIDAGEHSLQARGLYPKRVTRDPNDGTMPSHIAKKENLFKKYTPIFIYKILIRIVIFLQRVKKYLSLLLKGM